jgi:hypothetical protein
MTPILLVVPAVPFDHRLNGLIFLCLYQVK